MTRIGAGADASGYMIKPRLLGLWGKHEGVDMHSWVWDVEGQILGCMKRSGQAKVPWPWIYSTAAMALTKGQLVNRLHKHQLQVKERTEEQRAGMASAS